MTKGQCFFLLFSAIFNSGLGEVVTLSELWTNSPCHKEIIIAQTTNNIQLCVESIYVTQVQCREKNNAPLHFVTRLINANICYKIMNPEAGTWNCSFRSELHARVSYCTIHMKDLDDTRSEQELKVHEIIAWISFLALASTAVVGGVIIIFYYKKKVKRRETKEMPDHIGLRAPMELPSEITYDTVYCHRISWNLKRNSNEEQCCNKKPIENIVKLNENAGYIPHNNLFE